MMQFALAIDIEYKIFFPVVCRIKYFGIFLLRKFFLSLATRVVSGLNFTSKKEKNILIF